MADEREIAVLRALAASPNGRLRTSQAWAVADDANLARSKLVVTALSASSWVAFEGNGPAQQVHITDAGRNELTYQDWATTPPQPTQAPNAPQPPQAAAAIGPAGTTRAELLARHQELLADVLAELIFDASEPISPAGRLVSCPPTDPPVQAALVIGALRRLETQGHIRIPQLLPPPELPEVTLTEAGADSVRQARAVMAGPQRSQLARDALLGWLYEQSPQDHAAASLAGFYGHQRSAHGGQFFSVSEVDAAARYLRDQDLAVATHPGRRRGPAAMRLTASGIRCMEDDHGSVSAYLTKREPDARAQAKAALDARRAVAGWSVGIAAAVLTAATLIATIAKQPTSSLWFRVSLGVAAAGFLIALIAGFSDLRSWLGGGFRRARKASHGSR
jgi:hypothetical protein